MGLSLVFSTSAYFIGLKILRYCKWALGHAGVYSAGPPINSSTISFFSYICRDPLWAGISLLFLWPMFFLVHTIGTILIINTTSGIRRIIWVLILLIVAILLYAFPSVYVGVSS